MDPQQYLDCDFSYQKLFPLEHSKRLADKLRYRYPGVGGESYLDVIERIRPVIIGDVMFSFFFLFTLSDVGKIV